MISTLACNLCHHSWSVKSRCYDSTAFPARATSHVPFIKRKAKVVVCKNCRISQGVHILSVKEENEDAV